MDEIAYWVKTKRAPCLYKYDLINKRHGDAHCSKSKSPSKDVITASPKVKKKRKLSIFEESESEQNKKNIYFDNAVPAHDTILSKDSIISQTELNVKKVKVRKVSTPKQIPKPSVGKRNLRSIGKTQNFDSSLESGLFSGETKNKQSSVSKSVSKKSTDKYASREPVQQIEKKVTNGIFDDLSDVSGCTANYIRSTKQDSSRKLSKAKKSSKQLIKESQDNENVYVSGPLECSPDSCNNDKSRNGNVDKSTALLKFLEPAQNDTPRRGRPRKDLNASLQTKSSVTSRYFTRSKVNSFDLGLIDFKASTPIARPFKKDEYIEGAANVRSSKGSIKRLSSGSTLKGRSGREKSGFTACFSDSEEEQPVRKNNFFD